MSNLTLLQLNDLHGYLEPHPELVQTAGGWRFETLGGVARIASVFEAIRAERPGACLTLDNGDTFHGSGVAVSSRGRDLVPIMNALCVDAMTAHWEFAYGPQAFRDLAAGLHYPVLAANVYDSTSGRNAFEPSRIFERAGLRIGVIGLACPIVDKTMPPAFSEGLRFELGVEETRHQAVALRETGRVDLIVVLSHLGLPQDLQLARDVAGLDVIVSGHTHNRMSEPARVGDTLIFQSGCHGSFVGRLDLEVSDGQVVSHRHKLITIGLETPERDDVAQLVADAVAPTRARFAQVVGRTAVALHRYAMASTSMDDILLAAIATEAGVEIAFSNGWRYGAPIPPGPVTLGDLYNIIPMDPPITRLELYGHEIKAMLEDNLERTFACDPYAQMGGYIKRCRGLTLFAKIENPHGSRIERLMVGDADIVPDAVYRAAFVTSQGVPAQFGRNRSDLGVTAVEALVHWFATHTPGETSVMPSVLLI